MRTSTVSSDRTPSRRAFLKRTLAAGVAAGATMSALEADRALARDDDSDDSRHALTKGDAALLRFAAAAEILESDFWIQYNELGGIRDAEVPGGFGNPAYTDKLKNLDGDFDQYIHDNTDDEITHFTFLNAYLESHGAQPVNLEPFRTLAGSKATGSSGQLRLTNLMQLTLDTSWWTRYRSDANNPDLDPSFAFPQAVPDLSKGTFTAIPRSNADLSPEAHLQAIANTAAFHMPTIEQGGNSLYPSLAQRATSVEVLRILISIGPTETMHFQTWSDKAGAAVSPPLAPLVDPTNGLRFPDLSAAGEMLTNNLIMPEPCPFLSRKLPKCSVIRPTDTRGAAMGALAFLTKMGLFTGQSKKFFDVMRDLASAADLARRMDDQ
jgi:Ferritin-like domain